MAARKRKPKKSARRSPAIRRAKAKPARTRRPGRAADMPADLERRLMALAVKMEKTLDAVLLQALCEFADAWEDHFQTVKALEDDDRVQVAVRQD